MAMKGKVHNNWVECELKLEKGDDTRIVWIPERFAMVGKTVKALAPQLFDPPEEYSRDDWPKWIVMQIGQSLPTAAVTATQKKVYRKQYDLLAPSQRHGQG